MQHSHAAFVPWYGVHGKHLLVGSYGVDVCWVVIILIVLYFSVPHRRPWLALQPTRGTQHRVRELEERLYDSHVDRRARESDWSPKNDLRIDTRRRSPRKLLGKSRTPSHQTSPVEMGSGRPTLVFDSNFAQGDGAEWATTPAPITTFPGHPDIPRRRLDTDERRSPSAMSLSSSTKLSSDGNNTPHVAMEGSINVPHAAGAAEGASMPHAAEGGGGLWSTSSTAATTTANKVCNSCGSPTNTSGDDVRLPGDGFHGPGV